LYINDKSGTFSGKTPPFPLSSLFALKSEERRGELDSSSLFSL